MQALIINCSPVRNGATAAIADIAAAALRDRYDTKQLCIDDFSFAFCRGCRRCHSTARCVLSDDVPAILEIMDRADVIVCVSPSYWADVPGQFKAFIDRCTPWCNTHEPHARLCGGKRGYAIALRTGPGMPECERILGTIGHFYGHMEIDLCGTLGLCGVEGRQDVPAREAEIRAFCAGI